MVLIKSGLKHFNSWTEFEIFKQNKYLPYLFYQGGKRLQAQVWIAVIISVINGRHEQVAKMLQILSVHERLNIKYKSANVAAKWNIADWKPWSCEYKLSPDIKDPISNVAKPIINERAIIYLSKTIKMFNKQ